MGRSAPRRGLAALLLAAAVACAPSERAQPVERDLAEIAAQDTLVLLTTFNSTSYFIYRGTPMGFEYEAVRAFAESQDLALRTVVVRDRGELLDRLIAGEGDLAAGRVVPARDTTAGIAFTEPLYRTQATLVQRAAPLAEAEIPDAVGGLLPEAGPLEVRARLIERAHELEGDTVHVGAGTAAHQRLVELSDELAGDVHLVEVEAAIGDEALIQDVALGRRSLTATHEELAALTSDRFTNIAVQPVVGDSFPVVLALRENSPQLQAALGAWLAANEDLVGGLYRKYFVDRRGYRARVESQYLTSETGRLSPFDEILRQGAVELGWDWRLLASQAYQESRFDPRARSWAGATGLLQLMPATAREHGVRDAWDPAQNVAGAVRFLQWLENYWSDKVLDESERLRFVLASYNTGHGHVEDARRLTAKYGGNDQAWADVASWLLQKSRREVFTDPVVQYGFSRGLEPVTYVMLILERYEHYREFVTGPPEGQPGTG